MTNKERESVRGILNESNTFEEFSIKMELNGFNRQDVLNTLCWDVYWRKAYCMINEAYEKGFVPQSLMANVNRKWNKRYANNPQWDT